MHRVPHPTLLFLGSLNYVRTQRRGPGRLRGGELHRGCANHPALLFVWPRAHWHGYMRFMFDMPHLFVQDEAADDTKLAHDSKKCAPHHGTFTCFHAWVPAVAMFWGCWHGGATFEAFSMKRVQQGSPVIQDPLLSCA